MDALDLLLLGAGLLMFITLLAGVYSARLGLSFLLVFMAAGMLVGQDGPGGIKFDSPLLAFWLGNAALAVILLEGGISTRMQVFRLGLRPALSLATAGVLLTAGLVAGLGMLLLGLDLKHGLLLGAIVGSTDAAAVFSQLRGMGLRLHERLAATLEMESGLNDPMAVFLVLALIESIRAPGGWDALLWLLLRQFGLGAAVGLAGGASVAWLLRKLPLRPEQGGLLALLIVSGGIAIFAAAGLVEGSGFLAVYLFGLRLRALAEDAAHAASSALDGFAWAAQATLFLLLGLLVTPHELWPTLPAALAVAGMLMFVARPLAVWLCLSPWPFSGRERLFIGWVGLRGAVPIVLALFPLLSGLPGSERFFNISFVVVLASLLMQGTTLGGVARLLGVAQPPTAGPVHQPPVQGRLTLDATLALDEVFPFFQLPLPEQGGPTLGDWLTDALAKGHAEGDGLDWHGARFQVSQMHDGRIHRVALALHRPPAGAADGR